MDSENYTTLQADFVSVDRQESFRKRCGFAKTSDKVKEVLKKFPAPPPPSPVALFKAPSPSEVQNTCISAFCTHAHLAPAVQTPDNDDLKKGYDTCTYEIVNTGAGETPQPPKVAKSSRPWVGLAEVVQFLQYSVTATAVALYYVVYCYMQLVYFALRTAIFFHNADGPMKVTIGVVALTSLIVLFNILVRVERALGIF